MSSEIVPRRQGWMRKTAIWEFDCPFSRTFDALVRELTLELGWGQPSAQDTQRQTSRISDW